MKLNKYTIRDETILHPTSMSFTILITGFPGCGKGTISNKIKQIFNFDCYSVGELFRKEIQGQTEIGRQLGEMGQIVSADITMSVLQHALEHCPERVLLDGFPRSQQQLDSYVASFGTPNLTIILNTDKDICVSRLLKRGQLSNRKDDQPDYIPRRFQMFEADTLPVIKQIMNGCAGSFAEIQGNCSIEEVWTQVEHEIQNSLSQITNNQ